MYRLPVANFSGNLTTLLHLTRFETLPIAVLHAIIIASGDQSSQWRLH